MTNDLRRRVWEHKEKRIEGFAEKYGERIEGFAEKYGVDKLVYFERFPDVDCAILREKRIKGWKREWKIELIEAANPEWRDLLEDEEACMSFLRRQGSADRGRETMWIPGQARNDKREARNDKWVGWSCECVRGRRRGARRVENGFLLEFTPDGIQGGNDTGGGWAEAIGEGGGDGRGKNGFLLSQE